MLKDYDIKIIYGRVSLKLEVGEIVHYVIDKVILSVFGFNIYSRSYRLCTTLCKSLFFKTAYKDHLARLDIKTRGFWDIHKQTAFFNVRAFSPNAPFIKVLLEQVLQKT